MWGGGRVTHGSCGAGALREEGCGGQPGPRECSFNLEAGQDSRLWGKDKFHLWSVVSQERLSRELEVESPYLYSRI